MRRKFAEESAWERIQKRGQELAGQKNPVVEEEEEPRLPSSYYKPNREWGSDLGMRDADDIATQWNAVDSDEGLPLTASEKQSMRNDHIWFLEEGRKKGKDPKTVEKEWNAYAGRTYGVGQSEEEEVENLVEDFIGGGDSDYVPTRSYDEKYKYLSNTDLDNVDEDAYQQRMKSIREQMRKSDEDAIFQAALADFEARKGTDWEDWWVNERPKEDRARKWEERRANPPSKVGKKDVKDVKDIFEVLSGKKKKRNAADLSYLRKQAELATIEESLVNLTDEELYDLYGMITAMVQEKGIGTDAVTPDDLAKEAHIELHRLNRMNKRATARMVDAAKVIRDYEGHKKEAGVLDNTINKLLRLLRRPGYRYLGKGGAKLTPQQYGVMLDNAVKKTSMEALEAGLRGKPMHGFTQEIANLHKDMEKAPKVLDALAEMTRKEYKEIAKLIEQGLI